MSVLICNRVSLKSTSETFKSHIVKKYGENWINIRIAELYKIIHEENQRVKLKKETCIQGHNDYQKWLLEENELFKY